MENVKFFNAVDLDENKIKICATDTDSYNKFIKNRKISQMDFNDIEVITELWGSDWISDSSNEEFIWNESSACYELN